MERLLRSEEVRAILTPQGENEDAWRTELARFKNHSHTVARKTVGEGAIKAIQRMLVFLGYSTTTTGAFAIDGDFGRGTNRAVAQFQFDHGMADHIQRKTLCYPCTFQTARGQISAIPDIRLTLGTMKRMLEVAEESIRDRQILCGNFTEALYFLNQLDRGRFLDCRTVWHRYGRLVERACANIREERNVIVRPEWILAIIKQETAGIVRPRFEQHILSRLNKNNPHEELVELRYRAMSQGLGQILGSNYKQVGASSARAMFQSRLADQVLYVARFLTNEGFIGKIVKKSQPSDEDYRQIAKFYNGSGYAKHHYHESLASWFREFLALQLA